MQLGTVVYDVVVGLVMANHGGEHAWDITHSQAKDALYVRTLPTQNYDRRMETNKSDLVVQHRLGRIRFHHLPHKTFSTLPLPTSLLTRAMESLWLYHRRPSRHHDSLLHRHMHRENHAMYPSSQNLGQFDSWNLHQRIGFAQYKWILQYDHGLYHPHLTYTLCFETAVESNEEDVGCFGVYFWSLVCSLHLSNTKIIGVANLVHFSAPVFSTIGLVVRFRISSSPDITWNEPEILLWGWVLPINIYPCQDQLLTITVPPKSPQAS
jgi:hypothetical protein